MSAVVELIQFEVSKVRIRRRGKGKAGRFDLSYGAPYLLEYREPGNLWRQWGAAFNTVESAKWERFSIWGGPRPAPST